MMSVDTCGVEVLLDIGGVLVVSGCLVALLPLTETQHIHYQLVYHGNLDIQSKSHVSDFMN